MDSRLEQMLEKFGYTQAWQESGIFSFVFFNEQMSEHLQSGHTAYEHYRYSMFRNWLSERNTASDQEVHDYIGLALSEPDKGMACSVLSDLLEMPWLTDDQFEYCIVNLGVFSNKLTNVIKNARLTRSLSVSVLDETLFNDCLTNGNSNVHMLLLERFDLSHEQLIRVSESGFNK